MTEESINGIIDKASSANHPEPDMSVLREGRRKPPLFPVHLLGDKTREWLVLTACSAGAPVDYVAGALLAAVSALIGNSRTVSPWAGWEEPAALWIGLVGEPSSNKSPAIDPVINIIHAIENDMAGNFEVKYREWETQKEVASCAYEQWKRDIEKARKDKIAIPIKPESANTPEELVRPRIIGNDTSIEKLGHLLSTHHKGLLFYRDELAGWFGSFDKFGTHDSDKAFWIESYGGRSYIIDRVKHAKPIRIPRLLVSIMGGVQPDKLTKLIAKGEDDGFTARFLWIWPESIPPFRPNHITDTGYMLGILTKLSALAFKSNITNSNTHITSITSNAPITPNTSITPIPSIPCTLPLTEEAANFFHSWRKKHYHEEQTTHGLLKSSHGKAAGHVLRLSLAIELLEWASDQAEATAQRGESTTQTNIPTITIEQAPPDQISLKAIEVATKLMDDYFKPMAERVFGDASIPPEERLAATLAKYIIKTKTKVVNLRDLGRVVCLPGFRSQRAAKEAVTVLIDAGWIFEGATTTTSTAATGGRPRGDYWVNHRVWEGAE